MTHYWKKFKRNFKLFLTDPEDKGYHFRKCFEIFGDIERWFAYRTYDKYHIVKTGLKPHYYDKDHIMLYANFSILKAYVEHELAWMETVFEEDEFRKKLYKKNRKDWGRYLGLRHLDWECELRYNRETGDQDPNGELSGQALYARVKKKCYLFWVDQYLPYADLDLWQMAVDNKITGQQALHIEEFWENLADRRLSQLMKVRQGLWT